ncbi:MAG: hypothetical protein WD969_02680 [Paracoccaceae bacterium]
MRNEVCAEIAGRRVVLMDSISLIGEADVGSIIICGSHGGTISGAFAASQPPRFVIFNDAGGGKSGAGRAAFALLDAKGIACATVSHESARIGDAEDVWLNGVISAAGDAAKTAGVRIGASVRAAVETLAGEAPTKHD